jgi:hypothetical protein
LYGHRNDRIGAGIRFRYHRWRVKVFGQFAKGARYFVAYVICRRFEIYAEVEFYVDAAGALAARRSDVLDACNTVDIFFKGFGNL